MYKLVIVALFFISCTENESSKKIEKEIIDKEVEAKDYEPISFSAEDGLTISAHLYATKPDDPIIVLCHQARFNKFEYDGIAQKLNGLGYNCLAIDQRSGGPMASRQNSTANLAREQGKGTNYLDAIPDINAAVKYASDRFNSDVILWGSSYSSTLALWEGMKNEKVRAVVSFSPGDYFPELGSLTDSLSSFDKPFFITCADFEKEGTDALLSKTELNENQIYFVPDSLGHHGSRALWPNQPGSEQYWKKVKEFLNTIKSTPSD